MLGSWVDVNELGEQSSWWQEGTKKLGRNCTLQTVFSVVGGSRAEGICRRTAHTCAVVTGIGLCWWGGRGICFLRVSPFYVTQLTSFFFLSVNFSCSFGCMNNSLYLLLYIRMQCYAECYWQTVCIMSQFSDNFLLCVHFFFFLCAFSDWRETIYACCSTVSLLRRLWCSTFAEHFCGTNVNCLPSNGGSITGTMSHKLSTAALSVSKEIYV
jgi:hypothetical protein